MRSAKYVDTDKDVQYPVSSNNFNRLICFSTKDFKFEYIKYGYYVEHPGFFEVSKIIRHRYDGPADILNRAPNLNQWYIHGKRLTGKALQAYKRALKSGNKEKQKAILAVLEMQNE